MKFMEVFKKIILTLALIIIFSGMALIFFQQIQNQRILRIIKNGEVVIDQEIHEWLIADEKAPLSIELYIRNKAENAVTGNFIFSGTLSRKGLEKKFLDQFIDAFGEERLKDEMKKGIDEGTLGDKHKAVYNYILRGRNLTKGTKFEPISVEHGEEEDYKFKFREHVSISSGEIVKIEHKQQLPLQAIGYILTIKIEDIEL